MRLPPCYMLATNGAGEGSLHTFLHSPLQIQRLLEHLTLVDCLERSSEWRKALYLLLPVYCKRYKSGTAKWKGCTGQSGGRGLGSFHALSWHDSLPAWWCVHQLRSLWIPRFRRFHGVSLCRPLVNNSISSPSLLPRGWELGWTF